MKMYNFGMKKGRVVKALSPGCIRKISWTYTGMA